MMIPLTLEKLNKDPAIGSSILLTFTTDCMGFLIFSWYGKCIVVMKNKFKYTDVTTPEAYFLNRRKIIKSSIYVNLLSPFYF